VEAYFRKLVLLFTLCYSVVLMIFVGAFMLKILSPRGFGIAGLLSMIVGTAVLTLLMRKARQKFPATLASQELDPDSRKRLRRSLRITKTYIAFLVFALIYGTWSTRGGPLWPRLVGIAINLCLTAALVNVVRKGNERLK
jgi:hypothetical protein